MGGNLDNREGESKKPQDDSHNWVVDNVAHPFVNQAIIEPMNAIASVSEAVTGKKVGRVEKYDVPESTGTASWLAQTLSGGVGAIAPYLVAGKMTGGAMQSGGRFLEANSMISTGGATAKFLASERTAMVLGAGLYGGARDPMNNETRFGNAVGSMVGMGAFELGNSYTKGLSLSKSIPLRALVGAGGGSAQLMTSNLVSEGNVGSFDQYKQSAASGAALNLFLPAAQHQFGKAIDATNVKLGRPISVDHFVARENWTSNEALKSVVEKSPLTRVIRNDSGDANIDQKANVVNLGPADGPAKLGHEVSHRVSNRLAESDFQKAAELLKADPEAAKQKYVDIRIAQEKASIEAERRINASGDPRDSYADVNPDLIRAMRIDKDTTYEAKFNSEADQFVKSGGKFRPATDNAEVSRDEATGLTKYAYDEPIDDPNGGPSKVNLYEYLRDRVAGVTRFERWTKVGGGYIEKYSDPCPGPVGKWLESESFPDNSSAYKIIDGEYAGKTVRVWDDNGTDTVFGRAGVSVTDGEGNVTYTKFDHTQGTIYAEPKDAVFGKYKAEDTKADGIKFHYLTDGGTFETYNTPMKATIDSVDPNDSSKIVSREVEIVNAWRSNGMAQRSALDRMWNRGEETEGAPVADSAPIKSTYILKDGTALELNFDADGVRMVETPKEGAATASRPLGITEVYPEEIETNNGYASQVKRTFDSTITSVTSEGMKARVQDYNPGFTRQTEYGDVNRVVYVEGGMEDMIKTNGNRVLVLDKPMTFGNYGPVKATESAPDGTKFYHKVAGGTVEEYPTEISTNRYSVKATEVMPNGLRLYGGADAPYARMDIDYVNKYIMSYDANNNLLPNGFEPLDNFTLVRSFNPAEYPDGKSMPNISVKGVRQIITNNTGTSMYQLVDNSMVTDAPAAK